MMEGSKDRIRHLYRIAHASEEYDDWDTVPRGWIRPDGRFLKTRYHWQTITSILNGEPSEDPILGEKQAHQAYSQGWISLGHGGAFNAIGHESVFTKSNHPAVETLRRLVSKLPHDFLRIEKQLGKIDPKTEMFEDFDVQEYDLIFFIRRGKLRKF